MTEPIGFRYRVRQTTLHGERALIVETEIPDAAPAKLKEGLARRAAVNAGGTCPCGARAILPNRAARRRATRARKAIEVTVPHEPDCPALFRGYRLVDMGPEVEL
jgi:acyl-CoA reductase-like NAD-dependent aldehyde dehydrogenase